MNFYEYYKTSEADEILNDAMEKLQGVIKREAVASIDQYKKENEALKKELKKMREKVAEAQLLENEYKKKLRTISLDDVFGQREIIMWGVSTERVMGKKCEKCNDDRDILYRTPLGKEAKEKCDCSTTTMRFVPAKKIAYNIEQRNRKFLMWYKRARSDNEEHYYTSGDFVADENVYSGQEYSDIEWGKMYFNEKEDCQKFCDWLNQS